MEIPVKVITIDERCLKIKKSWRLWVPNIAIVIIPIIIAYFLIFDASFKLTDIPPITWLCFIVFYTYYYLHSQESYPMKLTVTFYNTYLVMHYKEWWRRRKCYDSKRTIQYGDLQSVKLHYYENEKNVKWSSLIIRGTMLEEEYRLNRNMIPILRTKKVRNVLRDQYVCIMYSLDIDYEGIFNEYTGCKVEVLYN